jgi:hypothetical protein
MSKTANYEDMTLEQLNARNDEMGAQMDKLREEKVELNVVRKRKARLENIVPRLTAAGHDTSKMTLDEMEAIVARIQEHRLKNRPDGELTQDDRDLNALREAGHNPDDMSRAEIVDTLYAIKTGTVIDAPVLEKQTMVAKDRK